MAFQAKNGSKLVKNMHFQRKIAVKWSKLGSFTVRMAQNGNKLAVLRFK